MDNLKQNQSQSEHFFLPNLCQTVPLLLLILVSELCVLAWELAGMNFNWGSFGFRSICVQWIVLLSAAALCQLRKYLPGMSVRKGWIVSFVTIELIGVSVVASGYLLLIPSFLRLSSIFQVSLAIGIIAAMVLRYFQLLQKVIEHNQAEISSRMDALQARIKPHFLFNSLNTIAELIVVRPDDAEKAVENLSSLFRANLKETSSFCPLEQEVHLVKGFLELEKWRMGDRLTVTWKESIHDGKWPVPVLCLQPLVENAVVHGVASETNGGEIIISVLQTPRITTISVENSVGPNKDTHDGHGVGLDNVRHRLQVLYGDQARCHVERTARMFKVTVIIPRSSIKANA